MKESSSAHIILAIQGTKITENSLIENELDSNLLSVAFKIFLNYTQMIAIVTSFNLRWPFYSRKFFSFQSSVGSFSSDFFSIECFTSGT